MKLEINLPQQIYERLQAESTYSGEPMDSIISRSLMLYFSQQAGNDYGDNPFTVFGGRKE
ncbi:MAG: hypothetical protein GXY92_06750 [Syntrophomonadaceae bacterium]|nr:hypothetical protein [Syntrophomonadaceae bacterium]